MKKILLTITALTLSACCTCNEAGMATTPMAQHNGMTCSTAVASGMTCEACATTVTENLKKLPGIEDAAVDLSSGAIKIYSDGKQSLDESAIRNSIERSGYTYLSLKPTCK